MIFVILVIVGNIAGNIVGEDILRLARKAYIPIR